MQEFVNSNHTDEDISCVSREEAARMLSISKVTLHKIINERGIVPIKLGRRTLIVKSDLRNYIGSLRRA